MFQDTESRSRYVQSLVVSCPIDVAWRSDHPMPGDRSSKYKGSGLEWCDFRDYRPGDNVRRIQWRLLARRPDRPMIVEYEEDRKILVATIVDVSAAMEFGTQDLSKKELAALLVGSIIRSAAKSSDQLLFRTYSRGIVEQSLPMRSAENLGVAVLNAVLDARQTQPGAGGGLARALCGLPQHRSLVFVISDFRRLSKEDAEMLHRVAMRHDVVALLVEDLRERELPEAKLCRWLPIPGFMGFFDDGGCERVVLASRKNRALYRQAHRQRLKQLAAFFAERHISPAAFSTNECQDDRRARILSILKGQRRHLSLSVEPEILTAGAACAADCP